MRFVYWDSESHLIKAGNLTPRLVCVSWAEREADRHDPFGAGISKADEIAHGAGLEIKDGIARGLLTRDDGLRWLHLHLEDDDVTLCGHNIAYDFGVAIASAGDAAGTLLRLVFEKYRKGLIRDTQVRAQLVDIAQGFMKFHEDEDTGEPVKTSYHLSDLSKRYLDRFLRKKDTWRLKYALLDGVPLSEWPEEARRYAIDDAVNTLEIDEAIEKLAGGPIPDSERQHRAAWALHLMSAWGVRTDGAARGRLQGANG